MAIIYSYPLSTPKSSDLLIGTSVYDENAAQPVLGNPTVSFTLQSVLSMIASSTGAQNLQQVTNIGNTTTNAVVFESSISVTGRFIDSGGNSGTPAKILSSTGTGTSWITPVATGVTKIIAGTNVTITPAGGIGNVTINSSGGLVTSLTTTGTGVSTLVSGVLNIPTPVIPAVPFVSLTTTGTSGDATLTTGVLNIPDYANTQNTLTTTGTGVATLVGTVLNIPTPVIPVVNFTSLTTTGAGAATLSAGVLNVPTPVIPVVNFTSLTTTGTSGASTLSSGVLNVPNYVNTQNTLTTTGTGAATLSGTVLNIPTPVIPTVPFTSLTTTGTSGASTLTSGVLNIPQYAGGGGGVTGSGAVTQITSWDSATSITGVAEYTIDSNFNVSQAADTDVKNTIGRAVVYGDTDFAVFSHIDRQGGLTYAFMASPFGSTYINATGGSQAVYILDDNSTVAYFDKDLISLGAVNVQLPAYGSGTVTGTAAYNLSVDSAGKIIETANTASSGAIVKVIKNSFTASQIQQGGTLTYTMTAVPVGKQVIIENCLFYIDAGSTVFNAPFGYTVALKYLDGTGTTQDLALPNAQSFLNSTSDSMSIAGSPSFDYPQTLGGITAGGGGTFNLILPPPGSSPTAGNGELYISIEYKEISTGINFSL